MVNLCMANFSADAVYKNKITRRIRCVHVLLGLRRKSFLIPWGLLNFSVGPADLYISLSPSTIDFFTYAAAILNFIVPNGRQGESLYNFFTFYLGVEVRYLS